MPGYASAATAAACPMPSWLRTVAPLLQPQHSRDTGLASATSYAGDVRVSVVMSTWLGNLPDMGRSR